MIAVPQTVRLASCSGCSLRARQSTAYCPERPRGRRLALRRASGVRESRGGRHGIQCSFLVELLGGSSGSRCGWGRRGSGAFHPLGTAQERQTLRRANPRKVTGPLPVSSECKSPAGGYSSRSESMFRFNEATRRHVGAGIKAPRKVWLPQPHQTRTEPEAASS